MKFIPLNNARLGTLLSNIIKDCFEPDIVKIISKTKDRKDDLIPEFHGCSKEYLEKALTLKQDDYGFPRACLGAGMNHAEQSWYDKVEHINKKVNKVGNFLGTPYNALVMAYPDNGYIGWHHNGNAPGYNILMTYSQDGDGNFSYWDFNKKEIVVMPDRPGWSVKVGYYPSIKSERDKLYWHSAKTAKQRVSIAWVLNHKDMWLNMIETITGGEYDPAVTKQFQMS